MTRLACAMSLLAAALPAQNLMPWPAKIVPGDGRLVVDGNFRVALGGFDHFLVRSSAGRLLARLTRQTGMQVAADLVKDSKTATLVLNCKGPFANTTFEDESYMLEVTPRQAVLTAANPWALARGIETFLQLVEPDGDAYAVPALRIEDQPRFPWRGLLVDSARHFIPIEVMRRTVDGMAAVKLNVLHWHLSDDQGFRVESTVFPKLHQEGSDGLYYTQQQIKELIGYAFGRGIRVVPEFDIPGHTTAWFVGHPELASGPGPFRIERSWGVMDPAIDPTREEVYQFLDKLIGEMAALFPDRYFHIGGDEVNGKQWNANPKIQEFKTAKGFKDNHALQAYFNQRLLAILTKHGKKMVGWDEILHPDLPKDIVVHSWRGQKSLGQAARGGYQGILSAGWYLDHILAAAQHYRVDPLSKEAGELSAEDTKRILGGEACMWSEFVSGENIDSRIWPRTAAIAERLWSPREVTDVASMYRRLEPMSRKLEFLGLTHQSSYRLMLERLAGTRDIGALRVLADLVEPVKFYQRGRARKYTQQTPFNRLVDAARPESDAAREFGELVDAFLRDKQTSRDEIRKRLTAWRDNDAALRPSLKTTAQLKEIAPLSQDLAALAAAGLEALDFLGGGNRPAAGWLEKQAATIKAVAKPKAEVLIMIAPAVLKLAQAAGQ